MSTDPSPRWYALALVALVVVRFILISHDEIRAFPYDESAYIGQAAAWYWKNHYDTWAYSRQPGYPLFLAIGSALGIPARLAIECVWVFAVLVLTRAVGLAGVRPAGRVLLVAALLFHPFTTELFCRALADNYYTTMLLMFLAALALAMASTDRVTMRRWGVRAGIAGGIAGITRQETILIYLLIVTAGLIAAATGRSLPRAQTIRRVLLVCAVPLVIALGSEHAVRAANLARIGSYVTYDWAMPGFKALYRTLLSVPPVDPRLRVPIPRDVRERAAAASPTYAKMLRVMEDDPRCVGFRRAGEHTSGTPGEPGSYNLWLLREAAWIVNDDRFVSARDTDRFYDQVERELRGAQDRGELPRRWAPLSFIPPEWGQLVRAMPGSLEACVRHMTRIGFARNQPYPMRPDEIARFDAVALRRAALMPGDESAGAALLQRPATIARVDRLKRAVARALPVFTIVGAVLAGVGAIGGVALRRARVLPPEWYTLSALLWSAFALRLALVAMLDATGVLASNRYMFPSAVLLVPMAVLGLRGIAQVIKRHGPTITTSGS